MDWEWEYNWLIAFQATKVVLESFVHSNFWWVQKGRGKPPVDLDSNLEKWHVQEMEKVGPSRQYTLVYFNAFAELSAIPDNIFFQQLHAALHPTHKRNMKVTFN